MTAQITSQHTQMNQIEGTTFSLHFMCKKWRLAVEQRDSSLLWTNDWPQCLWCCSQPKAGISFPHKRSYLKFGLIAAVRDEMKGVPFTWMNYSTGGKVTIFFILLLNEALKNLPGRIFFQLSLLTLEWL